MYSSIKWWTVLSLHWQLRFVRNLSALVSYQVKLTRKEPFIILCLQEQLYVYRDLWAVWGQWLSKRRHPCTDNLITHSRSNCIWMCTLYLLLFCCPQPTCKPLYIAISTKCKHIHTGVGMFNLLWGHKFHQRTENPGLACSLDTRGPFWYPILKQYSSLFASKVGGGGGMYPLCPHDSYTYETSCITFINFVHAADISAHIFHVAKLVLKDAYHSLN